jgi:poly-gamma-glutamate synthesis protein (capsule biosynthesis protein)
LLTVGSAAAIASDVDWADDPSSSAETTADPAATEVSDDVADGPRSFTIAASGELLIHESLADAAVTVDGWDFSPMLASVAPVVGAADLAICHIESPMSPDNSALSYYPAFNVPNQLAQAIADTGYDTCSVASNHALDTGRNGVEGTLGALDAVGVVHAGMARSEGEADTPTVIDVNGVKVAHLSYTYEFNGGDPPADEPYLANLIDEGTILSEAALAKEGGAEFVVVSLHWGTEYSPTPDASQVDLGPRLLGSDAIDLVIGTGSHVIQPVAAIGSEYLAYGLGNFLSNQSPESCTGCPPGTQDGVIIQLSVTETDTGGFAVTDLAQTPTWVDRTTYEVVPVLHDADQRDPTVLSASADRTAAALGAMGLTVPAS